ncbi:tryptophan-rich sensory protein [Streptomyces sp. NBC_01218]|uniref:TspO/MBR family protein n=1 Tax=unclassified Streptomyces TaxID=2593676 RepID=UPI0023B93934|nr:MULTISPECIES: TspO/MBR family protein [unclassified Streptomyces]WEH43445.1 tryptophan-rich sensory protein [Streptomyces sp. AM 2-1-1]WSQ55078.1 tryptophan-rich sensory protein [Streptomyces sp. NBC_01218]
MRLLGTRKSAGSSPAWRTYALTAAAVTTCAVAGAKAVDADSAWYRGLDKPSWQPPAWAFGAVWTPLYATIAWSGGHALNRARGRARHRLASSLAANLALNTAWNGAFFGRRSLKGGMLVILLLNASNAELVRRMARTDPTAARVLIPYAGWCVFATALNTAIARRNPA